MNQGFDRIILNTRERPLSSDLNAGFAQVDRTLREIVRAMLLPHASGMATSGASGFTPTSGFLGDALFPSAAGGMVINLTPGLGFLFDSGVIPAGGLVDAIPGLYDWSPYYPVYAPAVVPVTVPAAPSSGNERYDIIEVKLDRRRQDSGSRDVFNQSTGVFDPTIVMKTLAYVLDGTRTGVVSAPSDSTTGIGYKTGVAATAGSATLPATTSGYTRIAIIYVPGGISTITQSMIQDRRRLLLPNAQTTLGFGGVQNQGTPDTFTPATNPAMPAGVRVAVRPLGNNAAVRCYIFAGEVYETTGPVAGVWTLGAQHASVWPVAAIKASGGTPANCLGAQIGLKSAALVDGSEQTLLASIISVAVGQPYLYFDVGHRIWESTDSQPTSWTVEVMCPLAIF